MNKQPIPGESGMTWEEERQRAINYLRTTTRRPTEENITDAMNELVARDWVIAHKSLTPEKIAAIDTAPVSWRTIMGFIVFDEAEATAAAATRARAEEAT